MSKLLAISTDIPITPVVSFGQNTAEEHNGWGIVWYPEEEFGAAAMRDPHSGKSSGLTEVLADWDIINTQLLLAHLRNEASRVSYTDTHPFVRNFAGSSWSLAHHGELIGDLQQKLPIDSRFPIRPMSESDSDHLFCWLLSEINRSGASTIEEYGFRKLGKLLESANKHGTLNILLSDARSLFTYRCKSGEQNIFWARYPARSNQHIEIAGEGVSVHINESELSDSSCLITSSIAFDNNFTLLEPGGFIVAQRSQIVATYPTKTAGALPRIDVPAPISLEPRSYNRCLQVTHITNYRYETPVEKSRHRYRLHPIEDRFQTVSNYMLELSVNGLRYSLEDVFGNTVVGLDIDSPYLELTTTMSATVSINTPVDKPDLLPHKQTLPIIWMPWQAKMMQSYMLPSELPESQLNELTDYARSFSARNKGELLATLDDITWTIYSDYVYKQGSTDLQTTPYEVFRSRKGVCQDFANLMICLARMLNIPARYRVGYIYTGADYNNDLQSEASHAWVEAYLPLLGWRGYDPTNGVRVGADHVRVAAGRNYRDATPTSGVIYRGGKKETLTTKVEVVELESGAC